MTRHFFSVLIFFFIVLFIYFTVSTYLSSQNKAKIFLNRANIDSKIQENLKILPFIKNDTHNVVEFNSGYSSETNRIKRNFWDLFKNND